MATLTFSRSSATRVVFTASGLTASHTYSLQVYSGTSWVNKVTNLSGSTSYTKFFNVDNPTSYQARLWDATISGTVATGTIPEWSSIRIYAQCTDGVSQFTLRYGGSTAIVSATAGVTSVEVASGAIVGVQAVIASSGYGTPYLLYYNTASDPYGKNGPREFSSTTSISDTSFDRRIWVGATSQSSGTPVKPTIANVTTTANSATVYWGKNGGTDGEWRLYYGTSPSNLQLYSTVTSSPATITGLKAGTVYYFVVRNWVSGSSYADSDAFNATTKPATGGFAWTSNDAVYIAAGQPITNLTAAAWNNLIQIVTNCGGNGQSVPSATAGGRITAYHFNQMRNAIANCKGAGAVVSGVTAGSSKILARLFANNTDSLKEAINRVISAQNG